MFAGLLSVLIGNTRHKTMNCFLGILSTFGTKTLRRYPKSLSRFKDEGEGGLLSTLIDITALLALGRHFVSGHDILHF